jgi:glycosyltransferase involved in cell wall biosynthesis
MLDRIAHHFMASQAELGSDLALVEYLTSICKENKYDLIVTRHLRCACLPDAFAQLPVLVDIDDLNSEVWESRLADQGVSGLRRAVIARHASSLRRDLPKILLKCAGVWVAKNSDRAIVETSTCVVLPNIPFHFSFRNRHHPKPVRGEGATILAVASFKHYPNIIGFDYFIGSIWPLIINQLPLTKFVIIGAGIDDDTKAIWESYSGIEIAGYVSDLEPYYETASFTVAPLLSGGGTNIKVLESLAFGRACVCTQHAARGFDNAKGILIGSSTEEFAAHCISLLNDAALCECLGSQGFDFVTSSYSMDNFDNAIDDLIHKVSS